MSLRQHLTGTLAHKGWVFIHAADFSARLMLRAFFHDLSKFFPDEAAGFAFINGVLKKTPYASPLYKSTLKHPCILKHYSRNRHHPEFHPNGVRDMTMLDAMEMLSDWKAAIRRSPKGCLKRSVRINRERFGECSLWDVVANDARCSCQECQP